MPSNPLPMTMEDAIQVNDRVSVVNAGGRRTYFYGIQPFFTHDENDTASYHCALGMMVGLGHCKAAEVIRALHEKARCLCRHTETFRKEGVSGFFKPRKVRGAGVLTEDVLPNIQRDLDQEISRSEICEKYGIKYDTIRKAIKAGRLREPVKKNGSRTQ